MYFIVLPLSLDICSLFGWVWCWSLHCHIHPAHCCLNLLAHLLQGIYTRNGSHIRNLAIDITCTFLHDSTITINFILFQAQTTLFFALPIGADELAFKILLGVALLFRVSNKFVKLMLSSSENFILILFLSCCTFSTFCGISVPSISSSSTGRGLEVYSWPLANRWAPTRPRPPRRPPPWASGGRTLLLTNGTRFSPSLRSTTPCYCALCFYLDRCVDLIECNHSSIIEGRTQLILIIILLQCTIIIERVYNY